MSTISPTGALSTARLAGLIASVGRDSHLDCDGMRKASVEPRARGTRLRSSSSGEVSPQPSRRRTDRVRYRAPQRVSNIGVVKQGPPARRSRLESMSVTPLERVAEVAGRLERELAKAIVGQQRVVR